jgi:hypothetical protein
MLRIMGGPEEQRDKRCAGRHLATPLGPPYPDGFDLPSTSLHPTSSPAGLDGSNRSHARYVSASSNQLAATATLLRASDVLLEDLETVEERRLIAIGRWARELLGMSLVLSRVAGHALTDEHANRNADVYCRNSRARIAQATREAIN